MSNVIYKQGQISDIDEKLGIVKGYGSVFGNKDSDNDIIEKGVARNTLKKVIRELTADEKFMSLGLEQRVKEITKRLTFKARWMARRVVQTETTAAANNGISLSAQDVYGKDNLLKKWIAGGANIRDTHATASTVYSKKPIEENKPYIVGSSYLMFPGDTSMGALAKEIVNCKCISLPIIKAD